MLSKCMKVQTGTKHGTRDPLETGTLAHQWSIIGATKFSANPPAANASQTQFSSDIGTSLNQASLQRTILSTQSATLHWHCDGGWTHREGMSCAFSQSWIAFSTTTQMQWNDKSPFRTMFLIQGWMQRRRHLQGCSQRRNIQGQAKLAAAPL